MNDPLALVIELDGAWKKAEFENIPVFCFEWGKLRHDSNACPRLEALEITASGSGDTSGPSLVSVGVA
ncbi:hypothetical protein LINPERPRIM_LOCUS23856 [Linum perenne]